MQIGYLSSEGHLVITDTLKDRIAYRSYRFDEARRNLSVFGFKETLEPLGEVRASVARCDQGWAAKGKTLIPTAAARFYRTKRSYFVIGGRWNRLRYFRTLDNRPNLFLPFLSRKPIDAKEIQRLAPTRASPWIIWFAGASVKACRRSGARVELFATELREFTAFAQSKLLATVEFASDAEAKAFVRDFPQVDDVASLDAHVTVDGHWSETKWYSKARQRRMRRPLAVGGVVAAAAAGIGITALTLGAPAAAVRVIPIISSLAIISALAQGMRASGAASVLGDRWPQRAIEEWAKDAEGMAGAFPHLVKEFGVDLEPEKGMLEPLDRYLRSLPAEAFHPSFAAFAAAYFGAAVLGRLGGPFGHEWIRDVRRNELLLNFPRLDVGFLPIRIVREVWEAKEEVSLDDRADKCVGVVFYNVSMRRADLLAFFGFMEKGTEAIDAFEAPFKKDFAELPATSHVMGENHIRRKVKAYGPFLLELIETEVTGPRGSSFYPWLVSATITDGDVLQARVEGAGGDPVLKGDFAVLRFEAAPMVPLGTEVTNSLELGNEWPLPVRPIEVQVAAVSDEIDVFSERTRAFRPDLKDSIAPRDANDEGRPTSTLSGFVGRIFSVEDLANPFSGTQLWRIGVDISGLRLRVLVRKSACSAVPQVGLYASGIVWLGVVLPPAKTARGGDLSYIM